MQGFLTTTESTKRVLVVACLVVLIVGILLRLLGPTVTERTPDERAYAIYSVLIAQQGAAGVKSLVDNFNKSEDMWMYPPPIRVGYLWLTAAAVKLNGANPERAIGMVSCAASIVSLLVVLRLGFRFFNLWIAFVALLLFAVSPVDLAMARRAWQDELFGCVSLLMVWFCCEVVADPNRWLWRILLWIAGSYCLLVKESAIVVYGLCYAGLLWFCLFRERSWKRALWLTAFAYLGILVSLSLMAWASGGFASVVDVVKHNMSSVAHNEYAIHYQSGGWLHYWKGLWMVSPLATVLALVGIAAILARWPVSGLPESLKHRQFLLTGMVVFLFVFMIAASIPRYLHNLRYISPTFGVFYLLAGVGAGWTATAMKAKLKPSLARIVETTALVALVLLAMADYLNFQHIFIKGGAPDLANPFLRQYSLYCPSGRP